MSLPLERDSADNAAMPVTFAHEPRHSLLASDVSMRRCAPDALRERARLERIALGAREREASPQATEMADQVCMRRNIPRMHMPDSGDRVGCPLARTASRREGSCSQKEQP